MKKLSLKLFIIFSFIFLLFVLSNGSVFAYSEVSKPTKFIFRHTSSNTDVTVILPDWIYSNDVGSFAFYLQRSSDYDFPVIYYSSGNITANYNRYSCSSDVFKIFSSRSSDSVYDFSSSVAFSGNRYEYGNIYYAELVFGVGDKVSVKRSSYELVFQQAPQKVEQLTIPAIIQAQEIPQIMTKVLEMIIPIGLIVFSIGLLIYLVRLVILRIP